MPATIYVLLRVALGGFFMVVGAEKILSPYQNFQYVIESYEMFPAVALKPLALAIPWMELLAGLFLVFGLWLKPTLNFFLLLITGFLITVGQALVRGLDLSDCGCFGGLFAIPVAGTFFLDGGLLVLCALMRWRLDKTTTTSLDKIFSLS